MTRGLVDSSKYSPGNLTSKSLERLFVGRDKLLADVLHRVAQSATSDHKHRILLVGPRGIGKTHFVSLALQLLRTDPAFEDARSRLVISQLNEEEWGIGSYLDLLLRVIASCDLPAPERDTAERRVYDVHGSRRVADAIAEAEKVLSEIVGDRTLLIVCENLEQILSDLGTSGQQRWRSFLQERPFCAILATSTRLARAIRTQSAPFYGFFTVRPLEPLDFETALELLRRKAQLGEQAELVQLLESPVGRARVRAIHHLAGGNPRVYVAISEFITTETLDDLVGPFMAMADDLTPYYQARMQKLSSQQRKLIEQLSRIHRPRPVKAIADRCLITPQTAAKQLGMLAKQGLVRRDRIGRETYYELTEPLMRICFEIKDNRTRHLQLFVDLLRHWFSPAELRARLADGDDPHHLLSTIDHLHTAIALEECEARQDDPFRKALTEEQLDCLEKKDWRGLELSTRKLLEEREQSFHFGLLIDALRRQRKYQEASRLSDEALQRWPKATMLLLSCSEAFAENRELDRAIKTVDRAIAVEPNNGIFWCARGYYLLRLQKWGEVLISVDRLLETDPDHIHALEYKTSALVELKRWEEARQVAFEYTTRSPRDADSWFNRAWIERRAGDSGAAAQILAQGIDVNPDSVPLRCQRGDDLLASGQFHEALINERETLALAPTHFASRVRILEALEKLGRIAEQRATALEWFRSEPSSFRALRAYAELLIEDQAPETATPSVPTSLEATAAALVQANILLETSQIPESREIVDKVLAVDPANLCAINLKIRCLLASSDYMEALRAIPEQTRDGKRDRGLTYLRAKALVGASGLTPGVEALASILDRIPTPDTAGHALGRLFAIEVEVRGPVSLARQVAPTSRALPGRGRDEIVAGALVWLHRWLKFEDRLQGQQWVDAVAILQHELDGVDACLMPLELLSADVNFTITQNPIFLLALPIERRSLLDSLGDEPPPEFDP